MWLLLVSFAFSNAIIQKNTLQGRRHLIPSATAAILTKWEGKRAKHTTDWRNSYRRRTCYSKRFAAGNFWGSLYDTLPPDMKFRHSAASDRSMMTWSPYAIPKRRTMLGDPPYGVSDIAHHGPSLLLFPGDIKQHTIRLAPTAVTAKILTNNWPRICIKASLCEK